MTQHDPAHPEIMAALLDLASVSLDFGRVNRITSHQDGVTPESDTDHTVMLQLIAVSLARKFAPRLSPGRVAELALIHDLVEVYCGDTSTIRALDSAEAQAKREREAEAAEKLAARFGGVFPWIVERLYEYERLRSPEARFVKAVDKILPKMLALLNDCKTPRSQGLSAEELFHRYQVQAIEVSGYSADFPEILEIKAKFVGALYRRMLELERAGRS